MIHQAISSCDSLEWNGTVYNLSGIYTDTTKYNGCDSILAIDLTINGSNSGDTTILFACDSLEWNGITYQYNSNHIVNTVGNNFVPKDIIIRPGDTVTFINTDQVCLCTILMVQFQHFQIIQNLLEIL